MSNIDEAEFEAFVKSIKCVTPEEIENLLHVYSIQRPMTNIVCKFFLMRCTADAVRDTDLIKFMLRKLVFYVLKKKEYEGKKFEEFRDLWIRAKEKFVRYRKTGEPGELLLFLLLESEGIVQLFSKMGLKTNGNMAFHGYDAVHVQGGNPIAFHFGHSKMYANRGAAISDALSDVKKFNADISQKDLELDLISSHVDDSKFGSHAETVKKLINPYAKNKELYAEANSVFIGWNWKFQKNDNADSGKSLDQLMQENYEILHSNCASEIKDMVSQDAEIKGQRFLFFLLPFASVDDFRQKFVRELTR